MNKFVQLLSMCQKFWNWLTGWDNYLQADPTLSQKNGEQRPIQFYEGLSTKPILFSFTIWMLISIIVNSGPLFLLVTLMTASLIGVQYLCFKYTAKKYITIRKQKIDAKAYEEEYECRVLYNNKSYSLTPNKTWGFASDVIEEGKENLTRTFIVSSNDDDQTFLVTEKLEISEGLIDGCKAVFGTSLFFSVIGLIVFILAIISLF